MMLAKLPRRGVEKPRRWDAGPGRFNAGSKYSPVSLFLPLWETANDTLVRDVSGYHRHGTVNGSPGWEVTAVGQALNLDGVNDYVSIPAFAYGPSFTVGFWFNIPDNSGTAFKYIFSHGPVGVNNSLNIYVPEASASNPGIIRTNFRDNDDTDLNSALDVAAGFADGNWHFYQLSVSKAAGSSVYVDGVLRASAGTRGGDSFNPTGIVAFGGKADQNPDRFYAGYLGGLLILSKHLNAEEAAGLYINPWELLLSDYAAFFVGDVPGENKRRSSGCHFCLTTYPVPDAVIGAADRAQASWLYMGIAIAGAGAGTGKFIPEQLAFNPIGGIY